ncbi:hypothetical protein D030_0568A, partial [Vibrio parahaemolyticus AQ3810]
MRGMNTASVAPTEITAGQLRPWCFTLCL